jgi:lipoprotein-releasing system permease protein
MYKLLLCWRYLRTRYIALASIISVTLGVATMIVVNAVMAGFSHEMEDKMHGILSDVVLESRSIGGFGDSEAHMDAIQKIAGQWMQGMTPTVHTPAMITFQAHGGGLVQRQIMFIGIDERTYSSVSDLNKYLQHADNRKQLSWELRDGGYDEHDHQGNEKSAPRPELPNSGWPWRRFEIERQKAWQQTQAAINGRSPNGNAPPVVPDAVDSAAAAVERDPFKPPASVADRDPFRQRPSQPAKEDDPLQPFPAVVPGIALFSYRDHEGIDRFLMLPGDDVDIFVPTAGDIPKPNHRRFTIVDFYESKMSEYDSTFVFAPIRQLQEIRGMGDNVTSIQIKLKPGANGEMVRDLLRKEFPAELYGVYTWRDKQGALLAAVQMERAVLNILLFLIIAVAGFGILAIFFMIVVEKTRDVGILKSLGASSRGIMSIFLGYGLSLGIVGAGVGLAIGLLFIHYINQIRSLLEWLTGQPVFDPAIYYFYEIPTIVDPFTVSWIVFGALSIAVLASVMPALRAARLHPVEALRYE